MNYLSRKDSVEFNQFKEAKINMKRFSANVSALDKESTVGAAAVVSTQDSVSLKNKKLKFKKKRVLSKQNSGSLS